MKIKLITMHRILHVVAYASLDGSYGGPLSVALAQSEGLTSKGRHASLVAGHDGRLALHASHPVRLFRAARLYRKSFGSLLTPGLLFWALRRVSDYDVVHVHLARDLTTLPVALIALLRRVPLIVQTHGMVRPDSRRIVRILDGAVTTRVLRHAKRVIALTNAEARQLVSLGVNDGRIIKIENAVPLSLELAEFQPTNPRIVFASRLAARKRPTAFVQAAAIVLATRPDASFDIWGADEGVLEATLREAQRLEISDKVSYRGAAPPGHIPSILSKAQVLVLPSFDEPFPMVVLEALSVGLPSVITEDTGLSERLTKADSACVTDGSPKQMAMEILDLLGDESYWVTKSLNARRTATHVFSLARQANELLATYHSLDA